MNIQSLSAQWMLLKEQEKQITDKRRSIEDSILEMAQVDDTLDGTKNIDLDGIKLKVTGRMARKVDPDMLQDLANEAGLTAHLSSLFRWKADINASAWKAAAENITTPLLGAITTKAGRPSISITEEL